MRLLIDAQESHQAYGAVETGTLATGKAIGSLVASFVSLLSRWKGLEHFKIFQTERPLIKRPGAGEQQGCNKILLD